MRANRPPKRITQPKVGSATGRILARRFFSWSVCQRKSRQYESLMRKARKIIEYQSVVWLDKSITMSKSLIRSRGSDRGDNKVHHRICCSCGGKSRRREFVNVPCEFACIGEEEEASQVDARREKCRLPAKLGRSLTVARLALPSWLRCPARLHVYCVGATKVHNEVLGCVNRACEKLDN